MLEKATFENLPQAVKEMNQKLDKIERILIQKENQVEASRTDQLLTISQAAEFLKLSVPTIYGKVSKNTIPFMKRGKRLYFTQQELLAYIKEGSSKSDQDIQNEAEQFLSSKSTR